MRIVPERQVDVKPPRSLNRLRTLDHLIRVLQSADHDPVVREVAEAREVADHMAAHGGIGKEERAA